LTKNKNYEYWNPTLSFRQKRHIRIHLEKSVEKKKYDASTVSELAQTILEKWCNGEIIDKTLDYEKIIQELKIKDWKGKIAEREQRMAFRSGLASASVRIKPITINEIPDDDENIRSPYDESNKRLQCIECGCLFTWKGAEEYVEKIGELHSHLMLKHDRRFNALEKEVIENLTYEGDST